LREFGPLRGFFFFIIIIIILIRFLKTSFLNTERVEDRVFGKEREKRGKKVSKLINYKIINHK
jgi:hypothetical protein